MYSYIVLNLDLMFRDHGTQVKFCFLPVGHYRKKV